MGPANLNEASLRDYNTIRSGGTGIYQQARGLIAVRGNEAIQFLDGLISNDMKTLLDGSEMLAAFPNAQGRLLSIVRVRREGDRYLFDTEEETHEKVFQNLFRFTFAGDFYVEDLSDNYRYFDVFGSLEPSFDSPIRFISRGSAGYFIEAGQAEETVKEAARAGAVAISNELYETLRVENGIPRYGADMDETTIVPEIGLDEMISYKKGCYIGQEIIARIHFRGHVAKRLTGVVLEKSERFVDPSEFRGLDLTTSEGKNAGRITSAVFSPTVDRNIALSYVRYDHLADGTELLAGESRVVVTSLPFVKS